MGRDALLTVGKPSRLAPGVKTPGGKARRFTYLRTPLFALGLCCAFGRTLTPNVPLFVLDCSFVLINNEFAHLFLVPLIYPARGSDGGAVRHRDNPQEFGTGRDVQHHHLAQNRLKTNVFCARPQRELSGLKSPTEESSWNWRSKRKTLRRTIAVPAFHTLKIRGE
jgi:hypothetical protein